MSSTAGVRAGGAYIEIFARDGAFQQAMTRVQAKMRAVAQTLQRAGTGMSLMGAGLGAPLVLAARQAASFEDALLGMRAAAGLTEAQVKSMADEAKRLSADMGSAPEAIATAFMELAKAGMSVEEVLAGAGRSAVEFSRVSGVDAERSAVFMKAAMNVFGVSAQEAADTLSAAADSSETSIANMIESFSQVGSAGKAFDQSLFGISQAMAALAKSNIMGEEAGTAVKTMLTKLVAPTDDAQEALGRLGLSVSDFRDEMGRLLPMAQIAGVFERALAGMDGNARDLMLSQQALVDVFEQRGIKVITAFANIGEKGFKEIERQMKDALPVSEKFKIVMSGITGQLERLSSGVKRVSIAFGEAVSGPLRQTTDVLVKMLEGFASFIAAYPAIAVGAAAIAAGLVALGAAAIAAALGIKGLAVAMGALASPIGIAAAALAAFVAFNAEAFGDLETVAMRLQTVWRKVGIYIAAAFDSQVRSQLDVLLKQVDADMATWKKARASDAAKKPAANAARPDEFRKQMDSNPLAAPAGDAKAKASSAGTFGSTVGLGIGPQLADPMQQIADNTKKTADGVEKIVQNWKENPREPNAPVVDMTRGDANATPPMAQNLGDLPWWAPAEEAKKLGGFQGNMTLEDAAKELSTQLRLNVDTWKADAKDAADRAAAMAPSAAAGASAASRVTLPRGEMASGFGSVVKACQDTTDAIKSNSRLLERVANKLDGMRPAYA